MISSCINQYYIKKETIQSVKKRLREEGIVLLEDILVKSAVGQLKSLKALFKPRYRPMHYKLSVAEVPRGQKTIKSSKRTNPTINHLFDFVKRITGQDVKKQYGKQGLKLFQAGIGDYTLLNDHQESVHHEARRRYSFIFDMTPFWNPKWGGQVVVELKKSGESIVIQSKENSLLILNNKNARFFIKRINHHAKSKQLFLAQFPVR